MTINHYRTKWMSYELESSKRWFHHRFNLVYQTCPISPTALSRWHSSIWKCIFHVVQHKEYGGGIDRNQTCCSVNGRCCAAVQWYQNMETKKKHTQRRRRKSTKMNDLGRVSTLELHVVQSDLFFEAKCISFHVKEQSICVSVCVRMGMIRQNSINQPLRLGI